MGIAFLIAMFSLYPWRSWVANKLDSRRTQMIANAVLILGIVPMGFSPNITFTYAPPVVLGIGLGGLVLKGAVIMTEVVDENEVIVPAYTFQATASAPMAAGAIPVIVDIDPNNYCLDPKATENAITPKTKAIIPVHLGSNMADMDALIALAEKYNLIVIEDCAHAHGARWRGMGAGTM